MAIQYDLVGWAREDGDMVFWYGALAGCFGLVFWYGVFVKRETSDLELDTV